MRTLTPITANNEPTGTGDGIKVVFPLLYQGVQIFDPQNLSVWSVYRNDWQGNQRLYPFPRTNYIKQSQNLAASPWAGSPSATVSATMYGIVPYYTLAKTTGSSYEGRSISVGQAFNQGDKLTLTIALRASASSSASFGIYGATSTWGANSEAVCVALEGPGGITRVPSAGSLFTISGLSTSEDTLVQVTRKLAGNESDISAYIYPGGVDSVTSGDSVLAGRMQLEGGSGATSYIATAGSIVTTTDYTVNYYGSIQLATPPATAATLSWSGQADIYMLDSVSTILAQYANSPIITSLVDYFNQWIDPATDIDNFFNYCWNVLTAKGFGLDNWGTIVGVNRQITLASIPDYLGFAEALPGSEPWNQAPWYGGTTTSQVYELSDDAFRTLILTKALANISNFTAPSINKLLQFLFAGRGSCYVLELSPMQIEYVFNFALQPWEQAVLLQPSLLPRPAGVGVTVTVNP